TGAPKRLSACSTQSIARTTPAQNPRGEHSSTVSGGFADFSLFSAFMSAAIVAKWGAACWPVKRAKRTLRRGRGRAYIPVTFRVIADDKGASSEGTGGAQRRFAMQEAPLMPKATAVWLVDNTSLSFDQVAEFCKLHPLEVKAIADGDAAQGIKGLDPILTGQLTRDEIQKGEGDPEYRLHLTSSGVRPAEPKSRKKGPRYTPVSRRQDRPNAILWLVRNHPELKDSQIMRLVGTTKST